MERSPIHLERESHPHHHNNDHHDHDYCGAFGSGGGVGKLRAAMGDSRIALNRDDPGDSADPLIASGIWLKVWHESCRQERGAA